MSGEELQQGQALRGGRALQAPEQGRGWYLDFKEYKVYFTVVVLVFILVAMAMCIMYPGRRLGLNVVDVNNKVEQAVRQDRLEEMVTEEVMILQGDQEQRAETEANHQKT